jgi:hypothetical protein
VRHLEAKSVAEALEVGLRMSFHSAIKADAALHPLKVKPKKEELL